MDQRNDRDADGTQEPNTGIAQEPNTRQDPGADASQEPNTGIADETDDDIVN